MVLKMFVSYVFFNDVISDSNVTFFGGLDIIEQQIAVFLLAADEGSGFPFFWGDIPGNLGSGPS